VRIGGLWFWIVVSLVIAIVSRVIDVNTGDTTGPPYYDSLFNIGAFFVFLGTTLIFLALCALALSRLIRHSLRKRHTPAN
jgi:hypothetical protein